jgi:hypothetical protein
VTEIDNGQGPQGDSSQPADAGGDEHIAPDAVNVDDQEHDGGDQDGVGTGERKQRQRAQRAEARVAELEALVDSARRHIIADMVQRQGYKPGLIEKVETARLLDDKGMPSAERIGAAIADEAEKVGATPRRSMSPNPQQGHVGGQARGPASWSAALKSG